MDLFDLVYTTEDALEVGKQLEIPIKEVWQVINGRKAKKAIERVIKPITLVNNSARTSLNLALKNPTPDEVYKELRFYQNVAPAGTHPLTDEEVIACYISMFNGDDIWDF